MLRSDRSCIARCQRDNRITGSNDSFWLSDCNITQGHISSIFYYDCVFDHIPYFVVICCRSSFDRCHRWTLNSIKPDLISSSGNWNSCFQSSICRSLVGVGACIQISLCDCMHCCDCGCGPSNYDWNWIFACNFCFRVVDLHIIEGDVTRIIYQNFIIDHFAHKGVGRLRGRFGGRNKWILYTGNSLEILITYSIPIEIQPFCNGRIIDFRIVHIILSDCVCHLIGHLISR